MYKCNKQDTPASIRCVYVSTPSQSLIISEDAVLELDTLRRSAAAQLEELEVQLDGLTFFVHKGAVSVGASRNVLALTAPATAIRRKRDALLQGIETQ